MRGDGPTLRQRLSPKPTHNTWRTITKGGVTWWRRHLPGDPAGAWWYTEQDGVRWACWRDGGSQYHWVLVSSDGAEVDVMSLTHASQHVSDHIARIMGRPLEKRS